jgi:hypothetical protein
MSLDQSDYNILCCIEKHLASIAGSLCNLNSIDDRIELINATLYRISPDPDDPEQSGIATALDSIREQIVHHAYQSQIIPDVNPLKGIEIV